MSYILDALKKAEAERHLGSIPNVHAQPVFNATLNSGMATWRKPWPWIALTLFSAMLTVFALLKPPQPMPSEKLPQPPAVHLPATPATSSIAPSIPTVAPVANKATATSQAPPPAQPENRSSREDKPAQSAASAPSKRIGESAPAQKDAASEVRLATLHELPDHIKRELPQLSISGYLYSPNKADRTVLINQRLLREGDQVAPDLTLEKLTPGGMVLNYKGYRYQTAY